MKFYSPKQNNKRYIRYLIPTFLVALIVIAVPMPAFAAFNWLIHSILGPIFLWIIDFLGDLLIALIQILIGIAQYNDFIKSPAVETGWVIIRDVCNLFFIVILLVIALATVVGAEKYDYKKYLLPLLLMAILINFSKTIAGFVIDLSQVAMLQFVNGFKYAAAGNLTTAFGLNKLLALREIDLTSAQLESLDSEILVSLMLATAMLVVAVVTVAVILVVLLLRIIMLWLLVIFSPAAFLAYATPGGQSLFNQWWTKFSHQAIVGPVLAFMLWLSLTIMALGPSDVAGQSSIRATPQTGEAPGFSGKVTDTVVVGISEVGDSQTILSYIVSISLLIASLIVTQKLGVAGASIAMAAKGKLESAGKKFAKVGLGIGAVAGTPWGLAAAGYKGAKLGAKGVGGLPSYLASHLKGATGIELRPSKLKEAFKVSFERRKVQRELKGIAKAGKRFEEGGVVGRIGGLFGAPAWADRYLSGFLGVKGIKSFFTRDIGKVRKTEGQIAAEKESLKPNEDQLKQKTEEIKQIRQASTDTTINREVIDALNLEGLTAGTKEAERFLQKWDKEKARKKLPRIAQQVDDSKKRIEDLEKDLSRYQARVPRDYYARQAWRRARQEELSKIDTNDEDELIDLFESALEQRDEFLVAALSTKLAQVAGLNSLVNKYGYNSNVKGLDQFTNEILIQRLGMNEQTAYGLESDLSDIASSMAHHDTFGKAILVKGGRYHQAKPEERLEQQYRGYVEMSKQGKEETARQRNRLWYGWESPDFPSEDNFRFNEKGLLWIKDNWRILEKERNGDRLNPNAAQNFVKPTAFGTLERLVEEFEGDEKTEYSDFLTKLKQYAKSVKSPEETQADVERLSGYTQSAS